MAKRFTDTDKWKKPFIRGLQGPYKLLWFYILDDCNHAGIWEVDMEVAAIRIGEQVDKERAEELFAGRVIKISENKWFLPDFISFQYGVLNEKNRLHLSVIQILKKYGIKDLISPFQGAKDKDKDKDKDREKETNPVVEIENFLIAEMSNVFSKHNAAYKRNRERDYPALLSIAKFLAEHGNLSGSIIDNSKKIVEAWEPLCSLIAKDKFYGTKPLSTISKQIQEITQVALHGTPGKPNYGSKERAQEYDRLFNQRYGNG